MLPEPTQRQMDFIEKIEQKLDVSFEEWCDLEGREQDISAASDFIDEYVDDFRRACGH